MTIAATPYQQKIARKRRRQERQSKKLSYKIVLKRRRLNPRTLKVLEILMHESKNLFNRVNYIIREEFLKAGGSFTYNDLWRKMYDAGEIQDLHSINNFKLLKTGMIQQILRQIISMYKAHFEALKEWKAAWQGKEPKRFTQRPQPPYYKPKDGYFMIICSYNDIQIKNNKIILTMTERFKKKFPQLGQDIVFSIPGNCKRDFNTKHFKEKHFQLIRIIPREKVYQVDIVYNRPEVTNTDLDMTSFIGIDPGLNNLITAVQNRCVRPFIISGNFIKSYNIFYNKVRARLQSELDTQGVNWEAELDPFEIKRIKAIAEELGQNWKKILNRLTFREDTFLTEIAGNEWSKRLNYNLIIKLQSIKGRKGKTWSERLYRLSDRRKKWLENVFHQISTKFINYCVEARIGNLVIPVLGDIKRRVDNGDRVNQNFHYIPYRKLREMLIYKAQLAGIKVWDEVKEKYTSKTSSLDCETMRWRKKWLGKRVKTATSNETGRPFFKSKGGENFKNYVLNSDVNGALNILRKVLKDDQFILDLRDSGCWFQPVRFRNLDELKSLNSNTLRCVSRSCEQISMVTV